MHYLPSNQPFVPYRINTYVKFASRNYLFTDKILYNHVRNKEKKGKQVSLQG